MNRRLLPVLALLGTLSIAGCSTGSPSGTEASSTEAGATAAGLEKVVVGSIPFAETATIQIAMNEGIFEEHGLEVELADAPGGGAGLIPAVVSGDLDITYSNYPSVLQAIDKGLPLNIIRENDRGGAQGIYVPSDGDIEELSDLEGKRVAVNGLGNIMEITSRSVLEEHGVTGVDFVEIPPAQMEASVENGNVDGAWLVEPFVTMATADDGLTKLVSAFEGTTENVPVAGWVTSAEFLNESPDTVNAFVDALDEATARAAEDKDLLNKTLAQYTSISPDVIEQLNPIGFSVESDYEGLDTLNELMVKQGLISEPVDLEAVTHER